MGDFQVDTRVEGGGGSYRAALSEDWRIWGPNGGYLATIALRAAGAEAEIPRPVAFSGHFLRVARFAPVELAVERVHRSRRAESLRVSMLQDGRPVLEAMVRTAQEGPGLVHDAADAPRVPAPEKLRPIEELLPADDPGSPFPFWKNLESRPLHPDQIGRVRRPSPPVFREWMRFRPRAVMDDPFADAGRLLLLVDTLSWPAACRPHPDSGFIAPNLDVTCWFHRDARKSEWLFTEHESPVGEAGLLGTWGRVFDHGGRLLASGGAQLLCTPAESPR